MARWLKVSDVQMTELRIDQRAGDRRERPERRVAEETNFAAEERRKSPRRKVERRRQIDPTTCERDYSDNEVAFMKAMDEYKRKSGRMFPTWSEVLEVLHSLGYRRTEEPSALPTFKKG
ncbi:MAG: hypothetical protein M3552_22785 [Planctomycetota bacterium]|nr:hypothetical protein [Planctomycetaceae bacterium]MDQ3333434.1 hypothetical protein [Planctomycetota bacterium]